MKHITIREPIWKTRSVGIKVKNLDPTEIITISISYKDKEGNLMFPGTFAMSVGEIQSYPTQIVSYGVKLHLVPINDLKVWQS